MLTVRRMRLCRFAALAAAWFLLLSGEGAAALRLHACPHHDMVVVNGSADATMAGADHGSGEAPGHDVCACPGACNIVPDRMAGSDHAESVAARGAFTTCGPCTARSCALGAVFAPHFHTYANPPRDIG